MKRNSRSGASRPKTNEPRAKKRQEEKSTDDEIKSEGDIEDNIRENEMIEKCRC